MSATCNDYTFVHTVRGHWIKMSQYFEFKLQITISHSFISMSSLSCTEVEIGGCAFNPIPISIPAVMNRLGSLVSNYAEYQSGNGIRTNLLHCKSFINILLSIQGTSYIGRFLYSLF